MKKLVITGGHHTSALVVAKALRKRDWEIVWFGHRHTMWGDQADSAEYQEVTSAGLKFYDLKAGKFYRTYNPLKLIRIPFGFFQALYLLLIERPRGIVSFGGYLAVPTVLAGWLLGIPIITHEQVISGAWANKLIARFAKKIAVVWPQSLPLYPASKSVVIGLPVRPEILKIVQAKSRRTSPPIIYVTGGKQGAHILNEVVFAAMSKLSQKYKVIHQTGSNTLYNDIDVANRSNFSNYEAFAYSGEKALAALGKCDLVVGRSGAHTVYELGLLGKRSVLIPIPWVSHNEQLLNAKVLESAGLAVILPQNALSVETLLTSIEDGLALKPQPLDLPTDATERLVLLIEQEL